MLVFDMKDPELREAAKCLEAELSSEDIGVQEKINFENKYVQIGIFAIMVYLKLLFVVQVMLVFDMKDPELRKVA
ncbi:unnamed protein product [Schistocephalus solidus]|uniref:Ubiquitinyl hydrolase 1 n=1 Tax=Schistocephalus solidus TaxID=70667 RepID=A0A183SXK4_SCHSO|nr:unnamed protein product [Schistocephalus solidus]